MALPKSTKERIARHVRKPNPEPRHADMPGRVAPRANGQRNDPHRGGNPRLHNELGTANESIITLGKLAILKGNHLEEAVNKVEDKSKLLEFVTKMIAVRLGNWKDDGQFLVNESGCKVSKKSWKITEDGSLVTKNGNQPKYHLSWLIDLKQLLES